MNLSNKYTKKDILHMAGLAFLPVIIFYDVVLGWAVFGGDSIFQDFPLRHYYGQNLLQTHFPLWAAQLNFGTPFFAEIHTGLLYPPNLPFSIVAYIGGLRAWQWDAIFHIAFSNVLFYLYGRKSGLSRFASTYMAIAIGSSGVFLIHSGHNSYLHSLSWTGGILFEARSFFRTAQLRPALFLAFFCLMSFLAGSPPVFFMQAFLLSLYFLFHAIGLQLSKSFFTLKNVLHIAISLFLVLPLALMQLAATLPLVENSARQEWSKLLHFGFHSKWRSYWHFLYGNWFSYWPDPGHWEFYAYCGVLSVLLAVFAAFRHGLRQGPFSFEARFWLFCLLLGLVFAQAHNWVYEFVFAHISPFGMFRAPGRYVLFALLAIAWLAASGIDAISRQNFKLRSYHLLYFVFAFFLLLLPPLYKNTARLPLSIAIFPKLASDLLFLASGLGLFAILLIRSHLPWRPSLLLLFLITNNVYFNKKTIPLIGFAFYSKKSPKTNFSYLRKLPKSLAASLSDNFSLLGNSWEAKGYLTLENKHTYHYKTILLKYKSPPSPALLGAGAVLPNRKQKIEGQSPAYFCSSIGLLPSEKDVLDRLSRNSAPRSIYLSKEQIQNRQAKDLKKVETRSKRPSHCTWLSVKTNKDPNQIQILLPKHLKQKGFVFLSQSYYPGWSAYANGRELLVYRANYNFLAIPIQENANLDTIVLKQHFYFKLPWLGEWKW